MDWINMDTPILDYWNTVTPVQALICDISIAYFIVDQILDIINDFSWIFVVHHWSVCMQDRTTHTCCTGAEGRRCS
jgi:hypothetical protein